MNVRAITYIVAGAEIGITAHFMDGSEKTWYPEREGPPKPMPAPPEPRVATHVHVRNEYREREMTFTFRDGSTETIRVEI